MPLANVEGPQQNGVGHERDKVAIAAIRKAHWAWDKATREWGAVLEQSQHCSATEDSTYEKHLKTTLVNSRATDQIIVDLEKKLIAGTSLLDSELKEAAKSTAKLNTTLKGGNKLMGMIKAWIRHDKAAMSSEANKEMPD